MAKSYKTPGVYIEEVPGFPPSIPHVNTAVPAFVGFTEKEEYNGHPLTNKPTRISSMVEFEHIFGRAKPQHINIPLDNNNNLSGEVIVDILQFRLYHSLQLYFDNGGGPCYISSTGIYPIAIVEEEIFSALSNALAAIEAESEPTIIVLSDAHLAGEDLFYVLYKEALQQCNNLQNRVVIVDLFSVTQKENFTELENNFKDRIGSDHLKFGAAYYPYLQTIYPPFIEEENETVNIGGKTFTLRLPDSATDVIENSLFHANRVLYDAIKLSLSKNRIILPPSPAIAGIYCMVDNTRGIWKSPANISLNNVEKVMVPLIDNDQDQMNVDDTGKSVNAIRLFTGKGILVWGGRTLAGNDNEWRYVSVRRLFNWVNESVKRGIALFAFEPNDANTWVKVQAMIENFLVLLWRNGGLQGAKPEHAFYVAVGLNRSMNLQDISEGRMIVEIGMAAVRPAEFIVIRIVTKMSPQ